MGSILNVTEIYYIYIYIKSESNNEIRYTNVTK